MFHVGVEGIVESLRLLPLGVDAALDNKARNYSVPLRAVVEIGLRQLDEILDVYAGDVVVKIDDDVALVGSDGIEIEVFKVDIRDGCARFAGRKPRVGDVSLPDRQQSLGDAAGQCIVARDVQDV